MSTYCSIKKYLNYGLSFTLALWPRPHSLYPAQAALFSQSEFTLSPKGRENLELHLSPWEGLDEGK
ncbi:MAG: hypothetical protein ABFR75_08060 [Acidobacteriota bacterium]